jgi:hypothetical protein
MRVETYYNLHLHTLSYRPTVKGGKVSHTDQIHLKNVSFAVQPAGRAKVLEEKRKNVHAFVRGDLVEVGQSRPPKDEWVKVTYNPYKYESFVEAETGEPIFAAREVIIEGRTIYAWKI